MQEAVARQQAEPHLQAPARLPQLCAGIRQLRQP